MGPLPDARCSIHNFPLIGGICGRCMDDERSLTYASYKVAKPIINPTDMESTENESSNSNKP